MGVLHLDACTVDLDRRQVQRHDGARFTLTEQEHGLLCYLAARPGKTVRRDELLDQVWGYSNRAITRAIDVAIRRLRQKIEPDPSNPTHIVAARGAGYRFEGGRHAAPTAPDPGPAPTRPAHRAPDPTNRRVAVDPAFVGREDAVARLAALLAPPSRLVALTGTPGIGKSSLARAFARIADAPVVWTPVGGASPRVDAASLNHAVAVALGRAPTGPTSDRALADALRARGPLVVVLDDADPALPFLADTLAVWLPLAPELRVLITARQRSRADGEAVFELGPLADDDAVALLTSRAHAVRAGWGDGEHGVVRELVHRLDGNPLAIALAAARAEVLTPRELLDGLSERFLLLGGARRGSLYAAIDGSWSALTGWERSALAQCSVFVGSFSVAAAADVVDVAEDPDAPWLLDRIQALVGRSLVMVVPVGRSQVRYQLPESIRDFARVKGEAMGVLAAATARHRDHFAALGERYVDQLDAHGPYSGADGGAEVAHLLHLDADDLRAALDAAFAEPGGPGGPDADTVARLTLALDAVYARRGPLKTRGDELDRALVLGPSARLRAKLLLCRSRVHALVGAFGPMSSLAREAEAVGRELGDPAIERRAWLLIGEHHAQSGDAAAAIPWAERCADAAGRAGDHGLEARAVRLLALAHDALGDHDALGADAARLEVLAARANDPALRLTALHQAGRYAAARGRYALATERLGEAHALALALGDRHRGVPVAIDLSRVAMIDSELERGLGWLRHVAEVTDALGQHAAHARATTNIGLVLTLLDRGAEATACLDAPLSGPGAATGEAARRIGLATAHWQAGRRSVAKEWLLEAIEAASGITAARAHAYAAMVCAELADVDAALGHRAAAVAACEDDEALQAFVRAADGFVSVARGDIAGAEQALDDVRAAAGMPGPVYAGRTELVVRAELAMIGRRLAQALTDR